MHDSPENRPLPVVIETPLTIEMPNGETGKVYEQIGHLVPKVSKAAKACLNQDKKYGEGYEAIFGKKNVSDPNMN